MARGFWHNPSDNSSRPYLLEFRSSKAFILTTVCAAIFTDSIIYGVLVPVLPFSLRTRSGIPEDDIQWWTSFILGAYGLMQCLGSPIVGYFADHSTDRRTPFFFGLLLLAAATGLFGLATQVWVLVLSRLLQGFSTAVVFSVGFALLADTVGREEIGLWMGTALSSNTFGLLVSPPLGGLVYSSLGYGAVFWMVIVFIAIDVVLRVLMIERKTAERYYSETEGATINENSGTSYGTFGEVQDGTRGQSPNAPDRVAPKTPTSDGGSSSSPSAAPLHDKLRQSNCSLPPAFILLSSPRFLAAIYGSFINISILVGFDGVLPLFVKRTFDFSSLGAGLIFLNISLPAAILSPIVGKASDRFGARWIAVAGCLLSVPSLVLLRFVDHDSREQILLLCGLLTLTGCTLSLIIVPLAGDLSFVAEEKFGPGEGYAQVYSLLTSALAAGVLLGPVIAGRLVDNFGWGTMAWVMGAFSFSAALPCLIYTGGPLWNREQKSKATSDQEEDAGILHV